MRFIETTIMLSILVALAGCGGSTAGEQTSQATETIDSRWATITGPDGPQSIIDHWASAVMAGDYNLAWSFMVEDDPVFALWKADSEKLRQANGSMKRYQILEGPTSVETGYKAMILWTWGSGRELCTAVIVTQENRIDIVEKYIDC